MIGIGMRVIAALGGAALLGACASEVELEGAELLDEGPEQPIGVERQALAEGTLRLNDVYYVTRSTGFDGTRMFTSAAGSTVNRRLAEEAAVKVVVAEPDRGRYRVDHAGALGWIAAEDLTFRHAYDNGLSLTRINALARARGAMGFSYWWSNARWDPKGATTWPVHNTGSCVGLCGTERGCQHAASPGSEEYGSDCSGLVSTIWGFPDDDPDSNPTNNGFQTKAFTKDTKNWTTVPLADALPGDALVRYDDVQHHIVLASTRKTKSGVFQTYECRGCRNGCQTFQLKTNEGGPWHAIRRRGW